MMMLSLINLNGLLLLAALTVAHAFVPSHVRGTAALIRRTASSVLSATVRIEKDETSVGTALCSILEAEYNNAVKAKGTFVFGISGGSMVKMLSHLKGHSNIDWSLCTMAFCSHRCVALDDDAATYHKAKPAFLQSWMDQGLKVITCMGTMEAEREADAYEASLLSIPTRILPRTSDGYPIFDCLLIGVGTDGHVGSIYPNQEDVKSKRVVVPVTTPISKPVKISLSLATMLASKTCVVACAGKSTKAPLGKAEAMVRALESKETAMSFPASVFREKATWLIDEDSAVLLSKK